MKIEFFNKYKFKIKTINSLSKILNNEKNKKTTVMCHGVFDVVHPGHIRHLAFAKSKADILIVSITADKHIKKGTYRPHVPQLLRALNLAAFEMVDFVLIDTNKKPLNNISKIKPDFFAKGFEYSNSKMPPETKEEIKEIEKYGGKMIFTPGDVVYSSSGMLELSLPDIKYEKILMLMKINKISFNFLKKTISEFKKLKIHVVGDTIVDTYTETKMIGGQTKTPTISVLFQNEKNYVGGAGVVAMHLKAAGANVIFSTILGNDSNGKFVRESLKKSGIKINYQTEKLRPTTNKNVIISQGYRMLKLDKLDNKPISHKTLKSFSREIIKSKSDAYVFSDFRHGIFNRDSISFLSSSIPSKSFKVADSQVASRWGNICEFENFDLVTPNEKEARFSTGDQDTTVKSLTKSIFKKSKPKNIILKLGSKGIYSTHFANNEENTFAFSIDSFVDKNVDPVGAGDALLAYSTLSYLKTKSLLVASIIGSIAAACECEYDGNIPITPTDIIKKINSIEQKIKFKIK